MQAHNPKINWKIGEVKITRCPLICGRKIVVKERIERKRKLGKRIRAIKKLDRDK